MQTSLLVHLNEDKIHIGSSSGMEESYNAEEISLSPAACSSTIHSEKVKNKKINKPPYPSKGEKHKKSL